LPALIKRLQVTYTSVNLLTPQKTRFRYRLEGFDSNWIDAGQTRQAVYANLKPGSYRFVVTATQGQVAESTAALDVIVPPKYYQTTWFYVLCLCVGGGAGIDLWRRRLKKVHTRYSAVLAERSRLAREIHDTLLQGMVGVALQFHAILETLDSSPEQARRSLTRARDSLEHHIREARRSILDLRSPALEQVPFTEALRRTAHDLAGWSETDVEFVMTGKVQEFPRPSEEQLLRIGQEAISNAVQHANAATIRVELHYTDDGLALKVADDGIGFDPEDVKVKHWGLSSMKERASQIGARFQLSSSNQGTVVEVAVARAVATNTR
jgi:signal transduction histidine kinase